MGDNYQESSPKKNTNLTNVAPGPWPITIHHRNDRHGWSMQRHACEPDINHSVTSLVESLLAQASVDNSRGNLRSPGIAPRWILLNCLD